MRLYQCYNKLGEFIVKEIFPFDQKVGFIFNLEFIHFFIHLLLGVIITTGLLGGWTESFKNMNKFKFIFKDLNADDVMILDNFNQVKLLCIL